MADKNDHRVMKDTSARKASMTHREHRELRALKASHIAYVQSLAEGYEADIEQLQADCKSRIEAAEAAHEEEINDLKAHVEKEFATMQAKAEEQRKLAVEEAIRDTQALTGDQLNSNQPSTRATATVAASEVHGAANVETESLKQRIAELETREKNLQERFGTATAEAEQMNVENRELKRKLEAQKNTRAAGIPLAARKTAPKVQQATMYPHPDLETEESELSDFTPPPAPTDPKKIENDLLRPKDVTPAQWQTLSDRRRAVLTHVARINDTEDGMVAKQACERCSRTPLAVCKVYTYQTRQRRTTVHGPLVTLACSRCREKQQGCSLNEAS